LVLDSKSFEFNCGIEKDFLLINPIDKFRTARIKGREVEKILVALVEKMLLYSLQFEIELLPFLILGFFCGIRPNGELLKLEWRDIHHNDKNPEVVIRAEVNKTREARFIDLTENACAWLQAYLKTRRSPPAPSTRIVSFSFNILRKKREWVGARLEKETPNGFLLGCATPSQAATTQIRKRGQPSKTAWPWFNRYASKVVQASGHQGRSRTVLVNLPSEAGGTENCCLSCRLK
jgi:integrase